MPAGRPTGYKPEFCERVIELGKEGKSITQIACALDVAKSSIYLWEAEYPEFSDALTKARQHSQAWFENVGQNGLFADKFQSSLWAKQVSCRFPDDYRETTRSELTGKDGGAIKHEQTISPEDRSIIEQYIASRSKK